LKTAEAKTLRNLSGSTNPLAFWDEEAGVPVTLSAIAKCKKCIVASGTPQEKADLAALEKDEHKNGVRFSSLITHVCQGHLPPSRAITIKSARTKQKKKNAKVSILASARAAKAQKAVVAMLAKAAAAKAKAEAEAKAKAKSQAKASSAGPVAASDNSDDEEDQFDEDDDDEAGYIDDDDDDDDDDNDNNMLIRAVQQKHAKSPTTKHH